MSRREFDPIYNADPDLFSGAIPSETPDLNDTEPLRTSSPVTTNPFMAPVFIEPAVRPSPEQPAPVEEAMKPTADDTGDASELPTEYVDWTILPPGEAGARDGETDGGFTGGLAPKEDDPENVARIKRIGRGWRGSRLALSNVEASDGSKYQLVLLPAMVMGGLAVEHAIGDTGTADNAAWVYDATAGIEDGEIIRTWRDVFSGTKDQARDMGAQRRYHTATLDERLEGFVDNLPGRPD